MIRSLRTAAAALAVLLLGTPLSAWAQARAVTGTVTSNIDGKAVAGVSVRLKGAVQATTTDAAGAYKIEIPAGSTEVLMFSHPEHDPIEKELEGKSQLNVVMLSKMRINQYGVKTPRKPVNGEERGGFLVFESPDQSYKFWFDVRVQTDAAVFFGKTPAAIGNGIALRRLRFATKSQFTPHWYGELDLDLAESAVSLEDAYMMYSNDDFYLKIGNAKEVFSMETNTTSRYLTFMERPVGTKALVPSRRMGFSTAKTFGGGFRGFGGVYFQDTGDNDVVVAREDNNEATGRDEGYSLTGKLIWRKQNKDQSSGIHFGAATSYRTPKTDDVLGTMRFSARAVTYINRKKYVDTDRMKNVDYQTPNGLEGAAYYKNWRINGEYNTTTVNRLDTLSAAKFKGGFVMASVLLAGGHHLYNPEEGEFTQPVRGKAWGDLELAGRFEFVDLNDFNAGIKGGAGQITSVGMNWWVNNNVKFMLDYAYSNYDRYANGKGKFASGYDAAGNPTTNPQLIVAAKGKGGNDFHAIALRCEVNF